MNSFGNSYRKYVSHLEQINDAALNCPRKMIREIEEAYAEDLAAAANMIAAHREQCRIVMLSGPSSSGKTTTSHRLIEILEKIGIHAVSVSLDDFYRGEGQAPVLPDGSFDYEAVEALDVERVEDCLRCLMEQNRCEIPQFDFMSRRPSPDTREICLDADSIVVVEGIHALNPVFTRCLPEDRVTKIYVSVKQGIKDANGLVVSPMDLRLIRRIVRDFATRNATAEQTLGMWSTVVSGEDKYIRPYRHTSDITVNSIHVYEPCVLRGKAIPILRNLSPDSRWFRKARELEARLMRFEPVSSSLVPSNSLIREFIGQE